MKMLALLDQAPQPITATETEAAIARKAAERLLGVAKANQDVTLHVEGASHIAIPLPAKAVQFMLTVLTAMAEGQAISVIPHEAELSTKQAADFLNVSRPYICKLIDEGKLPARMVNRHRRVKFADLVAFETASRTERREALAEMAREARELGLE
jgi:excisionase family DNA binding protein